MKLWKQSVKLIVIGDRINGTYRRELPLGVYDSAVFALAATNEPAVESELVSYLSSFYLSDLYPHPSY
jgi:hypothetical protein